MDVQAVLSELRERVMAAHQQRQPLSLRGAGTKDFYRESDPGPDATPAFDAQASALDGRSNSGKLASARDGRGASGEFEARASTIDRAPGHGPALLDAHPSRDSAVVDLRAYRGIID